MLCGALQIHWFSIFNSFMMVIFLTGLVSMILMRTLRADYARYTARDEDDLEALERDVGEESGCVPSAPGCACDQEIQCGHYRACDARRCRAASAQDIPEIAPSPMGLGIPCQGAWLARVLVTLAVFG